MDQHRIQGYQGTDKDFEIYAFQCDSFARIVSLFASLDQGQIGAHFEKLLLRKKTTSCDSFSNECTDQNISLKICFKMDY